jgi:hypothetical protein
MNYKVLLKHGAILWILFAAGLLLVVSGTSLREPWQGLADHVGVTLLIASLVYLVERLLKAMENSQERSLFPNALTCEQAGLLAVFKSRIEAAEFLKNSLKSTRTLLWLGTGGYDADQLRDWILRTTDATAKIIFQDPASDMMKSRAQLEAIYFQEGDNGATTLQRWTSGINSVRAASEQTEGRVLVELNTYLPFSYFVLTDEYCLLTPYWADSNRHAPTLLLAANSSIATEHADVFRKHFNRLRDVSQEKRQSKSAVTRSSEHDFPQIAGDSHT